MDDIACRAKQEQSLYRAKARNMGLDSRAAEQESDDEFARAQPLWETRSSRHKGLLLSSVFPTNGSRLAAFDRPILPVGVNPRMIEMS